MDEPVPVRFTGRRRRAIWIRAIGLYVWHASWKLSEYFARVSTGAGGKIEREEECKQNLG
jgi:hypothetical protein